MLRTRKKVSILNEMITKLEEEIITLRQEIHALKERHKKDLDFAYMILNKCRCALMRGNPKFIVSRQNSSFLHKDQKKRDAIIHDLNKLSDECSYQSNNAQLRYFNEEQYRKLSDLMDIIPVLFAFIDDTDDHTFEQFLDTFLSITPGIIDPIKFFDDMKWNFCR